MTEITESTYTAEDMERYRAFLARLDGPMKPGLVLERTFKTECEPYWQTLIATLEGNPSPLDWYITHIEEVVKRVAHRAATVAAMRRGLQLAEFLAGILGESGGEPVSAKEFAAKLSARRAELLTFPEAARILAKEPGTGPELTWAEDYEGALLTLRTGADDKEFEAEQVDDVNYVTRGAFDDWRGVRTADTLNLAVFPDFAVEHIEHLKLGLQTRRESFQILVTEMRADLRKVEEALRREDENLSLELGFSRRVIERLAEKNSALAYNEDHERRLRWAEYSHREAFEHFGIWPPIGGMYRLTEKKPLDELDQSVVDVAVDHVAQLLLERRTRTNLKMS